MHRSMRPDEMSPRMLQELASVTAWPHSYHFRKVTVTRGRFVTMGQRKITPIFKKGKKNPGNYKLLSLTSFPEKGKFSPKLFPSPYVKGP